MVFQEPLGEILRIQALIVAGLTGLVVSPALAQPLFANPLDTPEGYREGRGATPDAKHRIRYEVTETQGSGASEVYEVTIDVASNWSLYRKGEIAVLNDFGLNRIFTLEGDTFSTVNGMSNLVFRVMERQNRTYLKDVLAAATAGEPMITDCQSDSELGLSLPMQKSDSVLSFEDRQGFTALICDGADVGGFTAGSASAPPALWPSLFHIAPMHPALLKRMRETGAVPATFETERTAGDTTIKRSFRLVDVESVSASYPLTDDLRNTTAETFDNLIGPDGAQFAADVVAGVAQGGAPTLESWGRYLSELAETDLAAAGMMMMPSFNMFPETSCGQQQHPICTIARRVAGARATAPAPTALIELGMAEQRGDNKAAISAMKTLMASAQRDHPAVAGSFALALLKFTEEDVNDAIAAGLPVDVGALQAKALRAVPYNPAYWTDMGDTYSMSYRWEEATLFFDVAHALPMPSAVASNQALAGKRNLFAKIRNDFPDAFLPR